MKLLQTTDYLLLIDEEVVCKTGELYLTFIQNRIIPKSKGVIQAGDKIIAYRPLTKEAKELDLPLLPPFEELDVEKLALEKYQYTSSNPPYSTITPKDKVRGFIEGYKAAQSKQ